MSLFLGLYSFIVKTLDLMEEAVSKNNINNN